MKIPPEVLGPLLAVLVVAQNRGWIDPKQLEPLLRAVVQQGYASNIRQLLGEILQMIEIIELEGAKPV